MIKTVKAWVSAEQLWYVVNKVPKLDDLLYLKKKRERKDDMLITISYTLPEMKHKNK